MILIFGAVTGGLGQPLHQQVCGLFEQQVVMAIGRQHCDVESEASIKLFFETILCYGPLHVINATGVSISAMIHKTEVGDIGRMLRVNLVSNILMLKHARELYKKHGGTFTMIGSIAASHGPAGTAVYAASKAALQGLVKVASKEFARINTRVNVIELGYTMHGMIGQVRLPMEIPIQLGRLGNSRDLAHACKFLIDCEYMTGAIVKVNGGL